ncbi:MAG: hypothetical protein LC778_08200 [Acidobacteria bacterium]|nr:hypothetical protein [Acidobacteriota bacterium]
MKQRNTGQVYDSENVCYGQISKPDNFLKFTFMGYGAESEHIDTSRNSRDQEIQEAKELKSLNHTQRQIAEIKGWSLGKVNALLNETEIDQNGVKPGSDQDVRTSYDIEGVEKINDMDGLAS